ncbi:UDP-N-acetylglucosamine 2-epimerase (non-hydrolyzing) [Bdellovibrio sp. ZAP7]|uniref:non-hydrolyzing UDP-N-acetylglucosamine 2-epimerase n=1 Tax=Bdellovibrio sp. ZAP7 TaxID=2231053 RepID=UPI00115B27C5|nr:UDP-N-acetylglucosamine 2-epimerase (non-hydrolyzing) [Bdellovibrio sp. ZAP7]QDK45349.1 UDP-N-acetylglucosamine 2-epimerase (non-hydrolyzing) [Bdellovibrio sp. ZAP7]
MKVMTIVGTRPELIKLSRVIAVLDAHLEHILVHTGQNYDYELNEVFFGDLEIRRPDCFMNAAASTPIQTIANVLVESEKLMLEHKPDAVLLYGDTNSCMAVIVAKRLKIPIFHMEAGNRCFDQRVPEEINRKIVDHLSDINMPLSEHARGYLIREGLPAQQTIKVGSSMKEIFEYYMPKIDSSKILEQLGVQSKSFILVSLHREENVDYTENLNNILESFQFLVKTFDKDVLVSTHPRTQKKLDSLGFDINANKRVKFLKPFGFCDYIKLQKNAFCVVSDSGTITEEASLLRVPAVTVRNAHERPEGMDVGTLIMSGTEPQSIVDSVKIATATEISTIVSDYDNGKVSEVVLKVICSYAHYVNRYNWRKMI